MHKVINVLVYVTHELSIDFLLKVRIGNYQWLRLHIFPIVSNFNILQETLFVIL